MRYLFELDQLASQQAQDSGFGQGTTCTAEWPYACSTGAASLVLSASGNKTDDTQLEGMTLAAEYINSNRHYVKLRFALAVIPLCCIRSIAATPDRLLQQAALTVSDAHLRMQGFVLKWSTILLGHAERLNSCKF